MGIWWVADKSTFKFIRNLLEKLDCAKILVSMNHANCKLRAKPLVIL